MYVCMYVLMCVCVFIYKFFLGGGGQGGQTFIGGGGQEDGIAMKDAQSKVKWGAMGEAMSPLDMCAHKKCGPCNLLRGGRCRGPQRSSKPSGPAMS